MSCSRIMNDNYIDLDIVSNASVSSEQAAFPATNIYNEQRRSKVWRSNGFWTVVSGENTIVFRETVGIDLTATVTAGSYTSDTTFFAAIKTALELVGSSAYTIDRDSTTNKITIESDGNGGGGVFQLIWTDPSSADMAEILGFDTSGDNGGALTYTADDLRIHTSEWVKWDFGISTNPKAFLLIGARNSPIKITPTATIKLQGNETDAWSAPSYEQTITYDENIMSVYYPDGEAGLHTEQLRYWRLLIVDVANPLGYLEIGNLYLGDVFEPTRGRIQLPFSTQYTDRSTTVTSEGGQEFSDILQQSEQFSVDWYGLTIAEKEDIDFHFEKVGVAKPFFISIDPNSAIGSRADYYTRFVKYMSPPNPTLTSPAVWSMNMQLKEQL